MDASPPPGGLFRQRASDRAYDPERLDRLLVVTDPRGWMALAALLLVVLAAGAWTVLGRVRVTVAGTGMLVPAGSYFPAPARAPGRVLELRVAAGDRVRPGQPLATLALDELALQIEQAEARLAELRERRSTQARTGRERRDLSERQLAAEEAGARAEAATADEQVTWLRERVRRLEAGARSGAVLADELERRRHDLALAEARLGESRVRIRRAAADRAAFGAALREEAESLADQIGAQRRELGRLRLRAQETGQVRAPRPGRVVEVMVAEGDQVAAGEPLLMLEPTDQPLRALVFVDAAGRRARPGMSAEILPGMLPWEEHGYLRGRVLSVSQVPATPGELRRMLANDALAERVLREVGAPYVVVVALTRDSTAASGYAWTMGRGPRFPVTGGMLATGRLVVEERRPITYLLPILRRTGGG